MKRVNPRLPELLQNLTLPVVAAPLFIASNPTLAAECMKAGIVGSFPALNARPQANLDKWITQVKEDVGEFKKANPDATVGPLAVNQIVHHTNDRLEKDVEVCLGHKVPIFITSLRAPPKKAIDAVHSYGGVVFHDVICVKHAKKAVEAGVDGLILVCAGAGGHAGQASLLSLVSEVRAFFDGPLLLSGAISTGRHVYTALASGCDLAYVGTRFLATPEANITQDYRDAVVEGSMDDIVYTPYFSGVHGNYLKSSIKKQGLDPDNLPQRDKTHMQFGSGETAEEETAGDTLKSKEEKKKSTIKSWKDIYGAGTGCGQIHEVLPAREVVEKMKKEFIQTREEVVAFANNY